MSDKDTWLKIPLEIFGQGRTDLIDEVYADDFDEGGGPLTGPFKGREGIKTCVAMIRGTFPDLKMEILKHYQNGNAHIGHIKVSGTMCGEFAGMPATGKCASWEEIHIDIMRDGKVITHKGVLDRFSMLLQLGFVFTPSSQV